MIDILNAVIRAVSTAVVAVLSLLPSSPFTWDFSGLSSYLGYFAYFVPVGTLVAVMAAYVGAVLTWYGIRWLLRFVRYIG